jgi:hypothetical protein
MAQTAVPIKANGAATLRENYSAALVTPGEDNCCCCGCPADVPSSVTITGHVVTDGGACDQDWGTVFSPSAVTNCVSGGTGFFGTCITTTGVLIGLYRVGPAYTSAFAGTYDGPCGWILAFCSTTGPFSGDPYSFLAGDSPIGVYPDVSFECSSGGPTLVMTNLEVA